MTRAKHMLGAVGNGGWKDQDLSELRGKASPHASTPAGLRGNLPVTAKIRIRKGKIPHFTTSVFYFKLLEVSDNLLLKTMFLGAAFVNCLRRICTIKACNLPKINL